MGPGSTAQGSSSSPHTLSPLAPPFTVDRWATTPRPPIEDPYNLRRPIPNTADPFGGRTAGGYGGFGAYGGGLRSAGMPESLYFDVAKPERDDAYGLVRPDSWNGRYNEVEHWIMGGDDGGSSGWKDTLGQSVSSSKYKSPLLHGVPAAADFVTCEDAYSTWCEKSVATASKNIKDTAKWLDKRCAAPSYDLSPDSSGYEQIPYSHIPETLPSVTWHPFQLNPISLDRFRPLIDSNINDPIVHCSSQYAYPVQSFLPQTSVISSSLVTAVPNIVKPSTPSLDAYRNKEQFGQSSVRTKGLPQGKEGYSEPSRIIEDMKPNDFSTDFSLKDYDLPSSRKSVSVKSAKDSLDTISSFPKPLSQQFEASHVLEANTETMIRQLKLPSTCLTLAPGGTSSAYIQSSSDASDQSNLAVDSPCWKGAAASRHFVFGVCEAVDSPSAKETSGGSNQGHVVPPGSIHSEALSSPKRDGDEKATLSFNNHDTEFKLSNDLKSGSDLEAVNTTSPSRTERNISSDAHPLSAATLSDAAEPKEIPGLTIERSFHNTNSQLLVHAIHNLSELLLSSCHNDSDALKEEDYDVLRLALDNFNACLRIKSGPTTGAPGTHSTFHLGGITNTHKETTIKVAGEDTDNVLNQNNHHSIHKSEAKMHSPKSDKNANEFLNGILFDGSVSKMDNEVTKPMKNVMTETFYDEEENPYKNLWIEAEVSLCSMKYQLQLAHMEMKKQRCKNCCAKDMMERQANVTKPSSPLPACDMYRDGPSVYRDKEVSVSSFSTEAAHAVESLYGNPLEARELSENHQSENVDCSVMARFRILKSRMENSGSMIKEDSKNLFDSTVTVKASGGSCLSPSHPSSRDLTAVSKHPLMNIVNLGFSEITNPWPFITGEPVQRENYCDEISLNSANEPASDHYTFHGPAKRINNGQNSPSSADWEYLLKDELT